ncbi:NfeD-like family protein YbbJ [uncultured Gammaproteobacteria bacterium]
MLQFWHWWVLAAVLGAADMLAQTGFLLWLGVAALAVGVVVFATPGLGWQLQMVVFAVLAVAAVAATRALLRNGAFGSRLPLLNRRGEQYVGQLVILETAIVNGRGRARVADTMWPVAGPDLPVGTTVRVVGADGALLQVERIV